MIFQVIIAVSEFKDKSNSYYHSRVLSLTKGIDKYELSGWVYNDINLPGNPGIWKITVEKSGKDFKIIAANLVYDISLTDIRVSDDEEMNRIVLGDNK